MSQASTEGSTIVILLAKEATHNVNNLPTELAWSPTLLKANARSSLLEVWQEDWKICTTGSLTRQFFPHHKDAACLKNKFIQHEITQVLTGHCRLKQHLHKIGKTASPLFECGEEEETVFHFLFKCPRFADHRVDLENICKQNNRVFPPKLEDIPRVNGIWNAMKKYILNTKRLKIQDSAR